MAYELRSATDSDKDWAYQLKRSVYRDVIEVQFRGWNESVQRSMFHERWNPHFTRVIVQSHVDIGIVALEDRDDHIWLADIELLPEHQGMGIGSEIVLDILEDARKRSLPVRLQVLLENHGAKRFYKRIGFRDLQTTATHLVMEAV